MVPVGGWMVGVEYRIDALLFPLPLSWPFLWLGCWTVPALADGRQLAACFPGPPFYR